MFKKINEYLDETISTKRKLKKKIEKQKKEIKALKTNLGCTENRATKWTNTARQLKKELEETKFNLEESVKYIEKLEKELKK